MLNFEEFKSQSTKSKMDNLEKLAYIDYITETGTEEEKAALAFDWVNVWSRPEQVPYFYTDLYSWDEWWYKAARGTGKTRSGAELVRHFVFDVFPNFPLRIGCVTPRFSDIQNVVAMGDSGVMKCLAPWEMDQAVFYSTRKQIVFREGQPNESIITFFSADDAEALRGPQFHIMWLDELAGYPNPQAILDQIAFCLRLKLPNGIPSKLFVTSTPKPYQFLRDKQKEARINPRVLMTEGITYDNAANLSDMMFRSIVKYEGTRWGRQEIYGEILSGDSAGIIKKSWLRLWPADEPIPILDYVFLSYDTAFTAKTENDPTGVVAIGLFMDKDDEYSAILLDAWDEHMEYPTLKTQVINDWENKYGEGIHQKRPNGAVIENKASGLALIPDLRTTNVNIIPFNPGTMDKHTRVHTVSWFFKDGKFYIPESRKRRGEFVNYLEKFIEQLTNFPLVEHDDMVDACTQVLLLLMSGGLLEGAVTNRDTEKDEDREQVYVERKRVNPYAQ